MVCTLVLIDHHLYRLTDTEFDIHYCSGTCSSLTESGTTPYVLRPVPYARRARTHLHSIPPQVHLERYQKYRHVAMSSWVILWHQPRKACFGGHTLATRSLRLGE